MNNWDDLSARKNITKLIFKDKNGNLVTKKPFKLNQTSHDFLFGCSMANWGPDTFNNNFLTLFNYATLHFFWTLIEKEKGKYDFSIPDEVVNWCKNSQIKIKGHPLYWDFNLLIPSWYNGTPNKEIIENHMSKILDRYINKIDTWDTINEPFHYSNFDSGYYYNYIKNKYPSIKQIINEYDEFGDMFIPLYNTLKNIAETNSVPFDIIGLQHHYPEYKCFTQHEIWDKLNKFSEIGKKIHITEFAPPSNGWKVEGYTGYGTLWDEEFQAKYTEEMYSVCFAHPSVEAITWWEMFDGSSWRYSDGLLRTNGTKKPVFNTLNNLINTKWKTNISSNTDQNGCYTLNGFKGNYKLNFDNNKYTTEIYIKDQKELTIYLPYSYSTKIPWWKKIFG